MKIINLTRHTIQIVDRHGCLLRTFDPLPKEKPTLVDFFQEVGSLDDIPLSAWVSGDIKYLPGEQVGTYYIVNMLTFLHPMTQHRHDLLTFVAKRWSLEDNVLRTKGLITRP